MSISVAINTLNEEKNLSFALRSVRTWADQIVVVDMHSSDRTREIAREFAAEVYLHEPLGFADPARAFAIEKCRSEWILILDADELIPPKLCQTLHYLAATSTADIVSIPRVNYMLGERLYHAGWGPDFDRQPRFFRRGKLQTNARIHAFYMPSSGARVHRIPFDEGNAIVHFNYVDFAQFIDKLNRYTSIEAAQAAERGERLTPRAAALRATREFLRRYLGLGGYRDGWRGFYLSLGMAFYRIAASGKLQERKAVGKRDAVLRRYAQEAEAILAGYPDATPDSSR